MTLSEKVNASRDGISMKYSAAFGLPILISFSLLLIPVSSVAGPEGILDRDSPFVVQVQGQHLTVRVRDIPLERILGEIAHQTWIRVVFHGSAESRLSADFSNVSLDEGLRRLSREMNCAFIFASKKSERDEVEIREIIIYPEGPETGTKAVEPVMIGGEKRVPEEQKEVFLVSLLRSLEDKDPLVREGAVDFLSEFRDEKVMEHLSMVLLEDQDEDVRASAARALGNFRDERAMDALLNALQDEEFWVRENVLRALGQVGGVMGISGLEAALEDEDKDTRELAADLLADVKERQ